MNGSMKCYCNIQGVKYNTVLCFKKAYTFAHVYVCNSVGVIFFKQLELLSVLNEKIVAICSDD